MISEGAFLRVFFPTSGEPREPGLLHIGYCLAVRPPLALVAYTTSQPWPAGVPLPFGVRVFTRAEALALNQGRPFRLHLNRQARIAVSKRWLPDLDSPGQGVIAMAPAALMDELFRLALELEKRHRLGIERLGV